jgi:predicted DNA-binding helix-hairpin-helix protein
MELQSKLPIRGRRQIQRVLPFSGAVKSEFPRWQGRRSIGGVGICQSYAPDGRCIYLLKVLLTNLCIYDGQHCMNRRCSNVRRAAFTAGRW